MTEAKTLKEDATAKSNRGALPVLNPHRLRLRSELAEAVRRIGNKQGESETSTPAKPLFGHSIGSEREDLSRSSDPIAHLATEASRSRLLEAEKSKAETEVAIARAKQARAQKDLERAQNMRVAEAQQAARTVAELRAKLEMASTNPQAAKKHMSHKTKMRLAVSAGTLLVATISAFVTMWLISRHANPAHPPIAAKAGQINPLHPAPGTKEPQDAWESTSGAESASTVAKTPASTVDAAVDRLGGDLTALDPSDANRILREVNKTLTDQGSPPCPLEWTDGRPALVYDSHSAQIRPEPIETRLARCAEAIERHR